MALSDRQKDEVLRLRAQGLGYGRIAKALGVTWDEVRVYLMRHERKHGKITAEPPTLDEQAAQQTERERLRALRDEANQRVSLLAFQQRIQSLAAEIFPQFTAPPLRTRRLRGEHQAIVPVVLFSDWHIGQKTLLAHTGGLFEQTSEIARAQIERWVDTFATILDVRRRAHTVNDVRLLVIGDIAEGLLRPRAVADTDMLHMRQALTGMELLDYVIRELLAMDLDVAVEVVGGNHDRVSQKAGNAGLGELGYEETSLWLVGKFLEHRYAPEPRVQVRTWDTFFGIAKVAGQRIAFEHGASFRWATGGYGGVPYYAISNASRGYIEMLDGVDIIAMEHGHIPLLLTRGKTSIVMNGALPPSTPYVQSNFKQVVSPCQVLLWLHPEHGLISYEPIRLDVGQVHAAESVWEAVS